MVKGKSDELMRFTPFHQMKGDAGDLSGYLLIQLLYQQGGGGFLTVATLIKRGHREAQAGRSALR